MKELIILSIMIAALSFVSHYAGYTKVDEKHEKLNNIKYNEYPLTGWHYIPEYPQDCPNPWYMEENICIYEYSDEDLTKQYRI